MENERSAPGRGLLEKFSVLIAGNHEMIYLTIELICDCYNSYTLRTVPGTGKRDKHGRIIGYYCTVEIGEYLRRRDYIRRDL